MRWLRRNCITMASLGEDRRLREGLTRVRHMDPDAASRLRMAHKVDPAVGQEGQPGRSVALTK
jgi:hypothetical protein